MSGRGRGSQGCPGVRRTRQAGAQLRAPGAIPGYHPGTRGLQPVEAVARQEWFHV